MILVAKSLLKHTFRCVHLFVKTEKRATLGHIRLKKDPSKTSMPRPGKS